MPADAPMMERGSDKENKSAAAQKLRSSAAQVPTAAKPMQATAEQNNADALGLNDEIVDMLMVLDYENNFCDKELRPISRCFFVYAGAASGTQQQFKFFTQLVGWLLRMVEQEANWGKYDDPNTVCTNMLVALKNLGLQVDAPPQKLKQGWGEPVCLVLHSLLKEVLRRKGFEFHTPEYAEENLADEAEVDEDAEVNSVDEEDIAQDGENEEEQIYSETLKAKGKEAGGDAEDSFDERGFLEATVNPKEWLLEVERVSSKLKIAMPNDSKEWRTHLQQTKAYREQIESSFPSTKSKLETLGKDLSNMTERIRSKESFINSQFSGRAMDYRTTQEELSTVQAQYSELNDVVMGLQNELRKLTEELDSCKSEMEERSSKATDTAPVVKIKDSFKRLRTDSWQLEVRIGVVNHTLMQAKLRQKPSSGQGTPFGGHGGAQAVEHFEELES